MMIRPTADPQQTADPQPTVSQLGPGSAAVSIESSERLHAAMERIQKQVARSEEIRCLRTEPARGATFASEALPLHPRLVQELQKDGAWPLWRHQGDAIARIQAGENTVVASSTASGKTHCYNLPVLDCMLRGAESSKSPTTSAKSTNVAKDANPARDKGAYALYLFPTKALAQDQMRTLAEWIERLGIEAEAGVYDGDTEPVVRKRLRKNGRIILTNPDMLHAAILPHHGGWAGLFSNLRYVVIDELHTLRGIFGSHVGNVLRRLRRIARHYGSDPVFIAASATIRNPGEHAEQLAGVPFGVVDDDGAPHGEKTYVLWNPPLFNRDDGTSFRKGAPSVAVRLLPELVRREIKTICFGRSRNTVELILRYVQERNRGRTGYEEVAGGIEAYRGGYLPSERRAIEDQLFTGRLGGVVATNALELGIDIGGLDACLIAGWPGSVCSFLQQAGRAGRRQSSSLVFLIAGQEPVDQYFMRHPEALFESNPEEAISEWQNPYILIRHLVCAAYERPLTADDREYFGDDLPAFLTLLEQEGELREVDGHWYPKDQEYPAAQVKLRTATDENFTIFEIGKDEVVGELDYVAAMLSLYEGAVYLHRTETFLVEEMDHVNQLVKIRRTKTGYYTQALTQKQVTVEEVWESTKDHAAEVKLAEVEVVTFITGYKKVRFHTIENIGYGKIDLPPLELDTVALVLEFDGTSLRLADPFGPDFVRSGMHGVARVLREILSIRAMCDPSDLDTFIDGQFLYVYDLYPGGIGYSEVGYERYREVLEETLELVVDCPCAAGCPSCVLPGSTRVETYMEPSILEYPYPKEATRFLLHLLLGKEAYEPCLDAVAMPVAPKELPPPELDPRTERKARKAARNLRGSRK